MSLTIDDLFASPDHYLHSYEGDTALFVPMDRAAYHRSIFLDGRIQPAATGTMALPLATLSGSILRSARTAWIFHMAHCGSTLLARALDDTGASLVLRVPLALRQTAIQPEPLKLALTTAMIGKRYRADAPTLVKANVPVNFLLPQLAAIDGEAAAILLYLPLRDYLLAILRSDNHRNWLRNVTGLMAPHLGDLSALSDAERAAALWLAQIDRFAQTLGALPNARALDAERFFTDPLPVLTAAATQLGIPLSRTTLEQTVVGPLFATYSKNPQVAFDNAARLARRAELERAIGPELDAASAWIETAAPGRDPLAPLVERALIR